MNLVLTSGFPGCPTRSTADHTVAPWQFNEQGSRARRLLLPCTSSRIPGQLLHPPPCALGPSVVMVTLGKALDLSWPIAISVTAYFSYYPHTNLCFCTSCLYLDSLSLCLHLYGLSFHCYQVSGYMNNITKKLLCYNLVFASSDVTFNKSVSYPPPLSGKDLNLVELEYLESFIRNINKLIFKNLAPKVNNYLNEKRCQQRIVVLEEGPFPRV